MKVENLLSSIPEDLCCSLFNQNTIKRLNELLSPLKEIDINSAIFEMNLLDEYPKYDVTVALCLYGERKLLSKMKTNGHENIFVDYKSKLIKSVDLHLINYYKVKSIMLIEFDVNDKDKSINPNVFFEVKNDFPLLTFINILFGNSEDFNCYVKNIIGNMEGISFLGAMISRTPETLKVVEIEQEINCIVDRILKLGFSFNDSTLYILNILKEEVKTARLCYNITKDRVEDKFDIEVFDNPLKVLKSFCKIVNINHEKMLLLEKWSKSNKNNNFQYDCSHIKLCFKFGNLYNIKGYFYCNSLFKSPDLFRNMRIKDFSAIYKTKSELRL